MAVLLIIPVSVRGESMSPAVSSGDHLIAVRTLWFAVNRGDLVVFRPLDASTGLLVKRVIAIPGDTIRILDFTVWLNGQRLVEPYLKLAWTDGGDYLSGTPLHLGAGEYFLLGDNRNVSLDSRVIGPESRNHILAVVWIRL
jgi:signal peptidase I